MEEEMKKIGLIALLAMLATLTFVACNKSDSSSTVRGPNFIANRTITIQAYMSDVGDSLPDNQATSPAHLELKRLTGIELEVRFTPGDSSRAVLTAQLAARNIPDAIINYLNNSTRPEFPVLINAARDGMFADISGYFAGAKAYNRYLERDYLPADSRQNIMWRDDLGGKVYLVHLDVPVTESTTFEPTQNLIGGTYIQEAVVRQLGIDINAVRTPEDYLALLRRIKNANLRDSNGRPMWPLGPKFWGGSYDALQYSVRGLNWGVSDGYNITADGRVLHEVETDWAWRKVSYVRTLLAEGLMDPEYFTMDETRAMEYYANNSAAIMGDVHNYVEFIYSRGGWIPLNRMADHAGVVDLVRGGKGGYCSWAISARANNPKEIFDFFDFMSTREGQTFSLYGKEGETYEMVNGRPRLNSEVMSLLNAGNTNALINRYGYGFGGVANYFFDAVLTNRDNRGLFGEDQPGMESGTAFAKAVEIGVNYPPPPYRIVRGLSANGYLNHEAMAAIQPAMAMLDYPEVVQQAIFAPNETEARRILESFKNQLTNAGLRQFTAYLESIYRADRNAINFY